MANRVRLIVDDDSFLMVWVVSALSLILVWLYDLSYLTW